MEFCCRDAAPPIPSCAHYGPQAESSQMVITNHSISQMVTKGPGWFKGMAQILVERGYVDATKLRAECKDFKCSGDQSDCFMSRAGI
ncbi:hypothetical protein AZE42_13343 [Rhizopogon vesiculosus]|uniref:Uncharacterized protein n=1 Tax=Rhizopogon vesiculosus TaxID=180088 RepID=A0A1J8Q8M2_9AGAM|nr:hypothetical protein AZE42_13343 [Rhizopogon vesiculosus]